MSIEEGDSLQVLYILCRLCKLICTSLKILRSFIVWSRQ